MFSLTQLLFTICLCPASNRTRLPIYSDLFFVCFCSRIIKKISTFTRLFSFLNQNTPTSHERPPIPAPLPFPFHLIHLISLIISPAEGPSPIKKARSGVWNHFTQTAAGPICDYCSPKKVFALKTATSSLWEHLRKRHPAYVPELTQLSVTESLLAPLRSAQREDIDDALLGWIVEDFQAFNVVSSEAFKEFVAKLNPRYSVPCRQTMSKRVDSDLARVKEEIVRALDSAPSRVACTTDGWTSIAKDSYVVITVHYIDKSWTMQGLTVSFQQMDESHTGDNLCKHFLTVVRKLKIEDRISCIVSDNAPSAMLGITLAAKALSNSRCRVLPLRCLPHILHLVVSEGFKKLAGPMEILKAMVSKLRSSTQALSTLQGFCAPNLEKFRLPQTDTPTRWNSTLAMIESMVGMKRSLDNLHHAGALDNVPTAADWSDLELLITLLKPFKEATELLSSSSSCTLSQAGFITDKLHRHLEEHVDKCAEVGIEEMIAKLLKYKEDIDDQALLPAFFDPRFLNYLPRSDKLAAIKAIKLMIDPVDELPAVQRSSSGFFESFKDPDCFDPKLLKRYPELARYLNITGIEIKDDPLKWWAANENKFPSIANLARDHLGMLASTVPSEEAFSAAGNTITEKRSKLADDTAEGLMITQSWRKFERKQRKQQ